MFARLRERLRFCLLHDSCLLVSGKGPARGWGSSVPAGIRQIRPPGMYRACTRAWASAAITVCQREAMIHSASLATGTGTRESTKKGSRREAEDGGGREAEDGGGKEKERRGEEEGGTGGGNLPQMSDAR
jgi:hypothetical protein